MDIKILLNFLTAIALGALVGIERQRDQKKGVFAGIRTFIMISFLGAIAGYLYQELDSGIALIIIFLSIVALVVSSYFLSAKKGHFGMTAEISAYILYFIGFIVMFDKFRNYGLIFGVFITILLAFKQGIHKFINNALEIEWRDTIIFSLIAFVILPILPETLSLNIFPAGRFEELNIINPKEIWLLVVFVSGISFVGYFIVKTFGTKRGTKIVGAMGGLVSSTAVTQSMATISNTKTDKSLIPAKPLVTAVLLATIISFIRIIIISLSINRNLYLLLAPISILVFFGILYFFFSEKKNSSINTIINLESPLKIKPALILGFLYAALTFINKLSLALNLGKTGIIITSIITGFFDVDPVILTVSTLSRHGNLSIIDAIIAILLATVSNQFTKSAIAITSGSKKFGVGVAKLLLMFIVILLCCILIIRLN